MKKRNLAFVLALFFISLSFVSSLSIEKDESTNIVVSQLNNPVEFDITIDPQGTTEDVSIFSFVGVTFEPSKVENLDKKETIALKAFLPERLTNFPGIYRIEYLIDGSESTAIEDTFRIKVIELKDAIKLSPISVEYGSNKATLLVKNNIDKKIEGIILTTDSEFFDKDLKFDLEPREERVIELNILSEQIKDITYGSYLTRFYLNDTNTYVETNVDYVEKEASDFSSESSGILVRKVTYIRENTGNSEILGEVKISRDVFSRLFTSTSINANSIERGALSAEYLWTKELSPGESFSVTVTTNYTIPFLLILIIIVVAIVVRKYIKRDLVISKRVSFVKTKGGEFALKVKLHVKANKYVEDVHIIDRLPAMTQLYEKFGVKPDKIDHSTRRLFYNVERLNAGEERVYSYVIFSKVSVVGRFELPASTAEYSREGKVENTTSNRAYFVAESGM